MRPVHTNAAPQAIGTYSQAMQCGSLVFISGQIPLSPETMVLVSTDIALQIEQVFKNLSAICLASGGDLSKIVKLQVYLTDLEAFPLVNEAMTKWFSAPYPARAVVEVSRLPKDAKIEIDAVMVCG